MRVCRVKATKKIIEMQTGGTTQADLDTLINNAVAAGYSEANIEALFMTFAEYQAALLLDPDFVAEKAAADARDLAYAQAKVGMNALPGWATWTTNQAETWITTNLGDLTTAQQRAALITAIKAMAKAILYLRDHTQITR